MKTAVLPIFLLAFTFATAQEKLEDSNKVHEIKEVTMTKKVFSKKSDRFVYDVAASPVAKGNTAFSLLKETPLVSSTDDKSLKILGKSKAVIYINGRKSNMNEEAVLEMLKNMPAENISKIEVITLPGSEFNVEASDGVINIILKKKLDDGVNGNLRMNNNQNIRNRQSAAGSINYRKNRVGISASLNSSDWTNSQHYILTNGTSSSSNTSVGPIVDPNLNVGGYLNMDYEINENQNLALSYNAHANKSYGSYSSLFNTSQRAGSVAYSITELDENSRSYNNSANLNYEAKTDDKGSKLNLNAAYLNFRRFQRSTNTTFLANALQEKLGTQAVFNQRTPQIINNYAFTGDYIKKFDKDLTLSTGANLSFTKTDNDTYFEALNSATGSFEKDANQSNHFTYDERLSGLYVTAEKKFSDKFSGKVGVRVENTSSEGNVLDTGETIKRNYTNVLPYLSVNANLSGASSLSYAFSSRVRRPSFWEINPVRMYLTSTNYVQNNPFVKASAVYNSELTYMLKQSYFLIASHTLAKDDNAQVPLQNGQELRYIRTNFGDKQELGLSAGMQKNFFNGVLTTNTSVGVQFNTVKGSLSKDPLTGDEFEPYTIDSSTSSLFIQSNNNLKLSKNKDWFMGVNFFYIGEQIINLGTLSPLSSLDLSVKKIWNDWTFNLQFRDVFRTHILRLKDTQSNGNYNTVRNNNYSQSVEFSLTYNFGNKSVKKIRSINEANKDIKSRTN